ncbi:hypothetical protein KFL_001120030 [Klebsormidium nitens]|uniref:Uncharacterized protein n=1 Tax=Klebsormidium nitens TaxID=105231 RepID=A0A1Y1HZ38_KLENI|nr:hypothetical protein KFL_001120030 [Klebsormidium nitens]|eukprot:GAQ82459.1 hypothetical protein KFL_001120030 [Klebsormidium nitens]
MAAATSSLLCSASAGFALPHGSSAQSLGSQNAIAKTPLLPGVRSNVSRRRAATCIKAVKNDIGKDQTGRQRAGLAGLLLPSFAAVLIGGTPFVPDASAEMSSGDYYKSLMESVKKSQTQAPVVAPILAQAPPVAAAAITATPVAAATPAADDDILSLFSSALETPSKKAEPKAAESEQPKAPTAAELRAKRVEEVAKREREQAEKRAAEQKALEQKAQEAKAQVEARAKEAAAKAEKEAEQQAKRAQETAKEAAKSKKTHGYLPLFLAQFLVLGLYAGAITVAFFLPKSQSEKIEAVMNDIAKTVGPVFDKVKPLADQAVAAGNKLAKQAQPLVGKAAKEAVPLVRKAVDASKPLVSQAQAKAGEALEKVKASQES